MTMRNSQFAMRNGKSLYNITLTALLAAFITVFTAYVGHFPLPGGGGAYLHFGDSLIFLAACLLPAPYAVLAGALGAGLADVLTAPLYILPTVLIKACVALCFSAKREKIVCARNIAALLPACVITLAGYFAARLLLLSDWRAALVSNLTGDLVQWLGSALIFLALGLVMDRGGLKRKLRGWRK